MRKKEELENPNSCLNRASDDELLFVLRGHDIAAPETIRAWIKERIRTGKNDRNDYQILMAYVIADKMEVERNIKEMKL